MASTSDPTGAAGMSWRTLTWVGVGMVVVGLLMEFVAGWELAGFSVGAVVRAGGIGVVGASLGMRLRRWLNGPHPND